MGLAKRNGGNEGIVMLWHVKLGQPVIPSTSSFGKGSAAPYAGRTSTTPAIMSRFTNDRVPRSELLPDVKKEAGKYLDSGELQTLELGDPWGQKGSSLRDKALRLKGTQYVVVRGGPPTLPWGFYEVKGASRDVLGWAPSLEAGAKEWFGRDLGGGTTDGPKKKVDPKERVRELEEELWDHRDSPRDPGIQGKLEEYEELTGKKRPGYMLAWVDRECRFAAIIDKPSPGLSEIFVGEKLRPEVMASLEKGLGTIRNYLAKSHPGVEVAAATLAGASVTYQYSPTSDIDLSVGVNIEPADPRFKVVDKWIEANLDNTMKFGERPFQFKIVPPSKMSSTLYADAVYDVVGQRWIKKPDLEKSVQEYQRNVADPRAPARSGYEQKESRLLEMLRGFFDKGKALFQKLFKIPEGQPMPAEAAAAVSMVGPIIDFYGQMKSERKKEYEVPEEALRERGMISQNWGLGNILYKFFERDRYLGMLADFKHMAEDGKVEKDELGHLLSIANEILATSKPGFDVAASKRVEVKVSGFDE